MPSQNGVLSSHAAEFWFPECRDCTCCKGFKHGCTCCTNGVTVCKDPTCSAPPTPQSPTAAAVPPATPVTHTTNPTYTATSPTASTTQVCRFYAAGNCRSGASCRFVHAPAGAASPGGATSGGAGGNAFAASPPDSSKTECIYFKQGNCQYGTSCRFRHG